MAKPKLDETQLVSTFANELVETSPTVDAKQKEVSEQLLFLSLKHKEISERVQLILHETVNLAMASTQLTD